jgi:hypothetical protein
LEEQQEWELGEKEETETKTGLEDEKTKKKA